MNNIEEFNKAVAMILTRLYDAFPHAIPLEFADIDEEADMQRLSFYRSTMHFLQVEGFIRYRQEGLGGFFDDCTLTMKGLQVMNRTPETLKDKKTLAAHIRDVAKEGSKVALRAAIDMLFREAM